MTRLPVVLVLLGAAAALVIFDLATSRPLDPFAAPPPLALGSGLAASGAHCAALPGN